MPKNKIIKNSKNFILVINDNTNVSEIYLALANNRITFSFHLDPRYNNANFNIVIRYDQNDLNNLVIFLESIKSQF